MVAVGKALMGGGMVADSHPDEDSFGEAWLVGLFRWRIERVGEVRMEHPGVRGALLVPNFVVEAGGYFVDAGFGEGRPEFLEGSKGADVGLRTETCCLELGEGLLGCESLDIFRLEP